MKIISKHKSNLIDRTEVTAELIHTGKPTPTTTEVKSQLAKSLDVDENLIIIKLIDTKFGHGLSRVNAYVYNNIDELKRTEVKQKKKKEKKQEAPK